MKKYILLGVLALALFTHTTVYAVNVGGGSGTITQLDQWKSDGTNITQASSGKPVRITGLENLPCIGTNASGTLQSGTCGSGSGSGGLSTTTPWNNGDLAVVAGLGTVKSVATGTLTTTATGLEFNNIRALVGGASVLSLTSGYNIPLTASTSEWAAASASSSLFSLFYITPSTRITAGANCSWAGNTFNCITDTSNLVTFTYASSTFPSFAYASSTFASTTWVTQTFTPYSYASSTYVTYQYASSTFVTYNYASSTYEPIITVLGVSRGGTGTTTVPGDQNILVGNGTGYGFSTLVGCNSSTQKLIYSTTTRTFSCAADAGAGSGISTLNGLTDASQSFATGTSGGDFNIVSAAGVHTFNLPDASSTARGALTPANFTTFNNKEPAVAASNTGTYYRGDKTFQTLNTSVVPELTNLYYTAARVIAELLNGNNAIFGNATSTNLVATGTTTLATTTVNGSLTIGSGTGLLRSISGVVSNIATSALGMLTTDVAEGTNLYYTDARARAAFSETVTGLDYSSGTGVLSLTSGFNIPLTASTTEWAAASASSSLFSTFYITPSTRIAAGTGLSWSGNTLNSIGNAAWTVLPGAIHNATSTDEVGIGTSTPFATLTVQGNGSTDLLALASSSGTNFLNLKASGNLGIGSSSPNYSFVISSSTNNGLFVAVDVSTARATSTIYVGDATHSGGMIFQDTDLGGCTLQQFLDGAPIYSVVTCPPPQP